MGLMEQLQPPNSFHLQGMPWISYQHPGKCQGQAKAILPSQGNRGHFHLPVERIHEPDSTCSSFYNLPPTPLPLNASEVPPLTLISLSISLLTYQMVGGNNI